MRTGQKSEDPVVATAQRRDQGDEAAAPRGTGREASEVNEWTAEQSVPRTECWSVPKDANRP